MDFDSVAVINPPCLPGYVSNKDSMGGFGKLYPVESTYFPPLDMPYMISYLEQQGHKVEVLECLGFEWDEEKLVQEIKS